MKLLLCCNKGNKQNILVGDKQTNYGVFSETLLGTTFNKDKYLNGKIIIECDFEVEKIEYKHIKERDQFGLLHNEAWFEYKGLNVTHYECDLASRSGFKDAHSLWEYLFEYLIDKEGYPQDGYVINIKNLHIFDEPRNPEDYLTWDWVEYSSGPVYAIPKKLLTKITRMTKVMSLKYDSGDYVIPLSPEEMCRIANKEQTSIIVKRVLKEMLVCTKQVMS